MQVSVSEQVRDFILAHDSLCLATTCKGQAWATPLFYQVDSDLRFYFISDAQTRHIHNALAHPAVALSIFDQHQQWSDIQGVQIEGQIARVSNQDRAPVEALYCKKFSFLTELLKGGDQKSLQVKQRFLDSSFYVVTPAFVRFIDNKRGFGFKEEYYISLPCSP